MDEGGIQSSVPVGWDAESYRRDADGLTGFRAATFQLPPDDSDAGFLAQKMMGPDDIMVVVLLGDTIPSSQRPNAWVPSEFPLQISRSDIQPLEGFSAPAAAKRSLAIKDRGALVFAMFGTPNPNDEMLVEANAVLSSVSF